MATVIKDTPEGRVGYIWHKEELERVILDGPLDCPEEKGHTVHGDDLARPGLGKNKKGPERPFRRGKK